MQSAALQKYATAFTRLKQGVTKYGPAPHKPVLLITLIELIDKELVTKNEFPVNADLVATFKENWQLLVPTLHQPDFTQPFYYLQSEKVMSNPYWLLQPYPGCDISSHIKSVTRLSEVCAYGYFEMELFMLLMDSQNRITLKNIILERYFSNQREDFLLKKAIGEGYVHEQLDYVLNEPKAKIKQVSYLVEEDVFVRNGFFKKEIPKIYNNRCSFTGMQLSNTFNYNFVDACHIVPFGLTHDDKVTNGIALCPNLHRAFDRGLVSIDHDYKILVSKHISEDNQHPYSMRQLEGKTISLPQQVAQFPSFEAIEWHMANIYKA